MLIIWQTTYIAFRFSLWCVMWFAVHLDAFYNRSSRGRGWRLHRGILTFLTAQVLFQTFHLVAVVQHDNRNKWEAANSGVYKAEVFSHWLAKSIFLCLLLLISSGYCILRDNLTGTKGRVFGMPVIYGVTSMVQSHSFSILISLFCLDI